MLRLRAFGIMAAASLIGVAGASAQADSGSVTVVAREGNHPRADVDVRSGRTAARTDLVGRARLRLPAGLQELIVAAIGFRPETLQVTIHPQRDTLLTVGLHIQAEELAPVMVTSTRVPQRLEDEPLRVEVLAGEDVSEKTEMRPGDLSLLLREISGVRTQPGSPVLGTTNIRIQGLPGRYTQVLSDGLPLFGGQTNGLGLLQIPPLDLQQAEVIKGAATALYGPSALGGVVNLVSRSPADERDVVLNQTSRSGTDGVMWLSHRVDDHWGYSVLGGVHRQTEEDPDRDGWADFSGFDRTELRPRASWDCGRGCSVFATVGAMTERRRGGTVAGAVAPDNQPFVEAANTNRVDGGVVGTLPVGGNDTLGLRAAATGQWQRRGFGSAVEHDRQRTLFTELALTIPRGRATWLVGAAIEEDAFHTAELAGFDYTFVTRSLFLQNDLSLGERVALSASGRCDDHSRYGTICSPRLSALVRAGAGWTARLSGATGFFAPTPLTGETEEFGLAHLRPPTGLQAERARYASLDLTKQLGPLQINGTLFASAIEHPVQLQTLSDTGAVQVALVNAPGPTRTYGGELFGVYIRDPFIVTLDYGWLRATEVSPETGARREVPLDPRQSAGLDVAWDDDESGTRIGIELFYTGRQALDNDPSRTTSAPYATLGLLASRRIGPAVVYLNGENLTNVRQTQYEPVLLPQAGAGGRWTTDAWAPLEGRVVNAGVRIGL